MEVLKTASTMRPPLSTLSSHHHLAPPTLLSLVPTQCAQIHAESQEPEGAFSLSVGLADTTSSTQSCSRSSFAGDAIGENQHACAEGHQRRPAAAEADASAVDASTADASKLVSTKRAPTSGKNTSAKSGGASTNVKNTSMSSQDASAPSDASTSKKKASAPSKNASISQKKASALIKKDTSVRKKQAEVAVSTLSGALTLEDVIETQPPVAQGGMRLRSQVKPAAPAATPEPSKAGNRAQLVDDSQEKTLALPAANDSCRPPTPVTARHVNAGNGDTSTVGLANKESANTKPKPKPKPVRRDARNAERASVADSSRPGATASQPDTASDRNMHDGSEAQDGQVMRAVSPVDHTASSSAVPHGRSSFGGGGGSRDGDASFTMQQVVEQGHLEDIHSNAPPHNQLDDTPHDGKQHSSSDVVQAVPPIVWQRGPPNVGHDVGSHFGQGVHGSVGQDVRGSVGQDVRGSVGQDVRGSVGQDVRSSFGQDVRGHFGHDIRGHFGQDVRGSIEQDVRGSVEQDVRGSVKRDIRGDLRQDGRSSVPHTANVQNDVGHHSPPGAWRAGPSDSPFDIEHDIAHNIPHNIPPNIPPNVSPNVQHNVQQPVAHHLPQRHDVPPHLWYEGPPDAGHYPPPHGWHAAPRDGQLEVPPPEHVGGAYIPPLSELQPDSRHRPAEHASYPHSPHGLSPDRSPTLLSRSLGNDVRADQADAQHTARGGSSVRPMLPAPWRLPPWRLPLTTTVLNQAETDTHANISHNNRTDSNHDGRAMMSHDVPMHDSYDVPADVPHNVRPDGRPDVLQDHPHDVPHDVRSGGRANVPCDVSVDVSRAAAALHWHHDVHGDVGADDYMQASDVGEDRRAESAMPHKKTKQVNDEQDASDNHVNAAEAAATPYDDGDSDDSASDDAINNDNHNEVTQEEEVVRDANDSADDAAEYEAIFGDTKAVGRVSKANKAIIKSSFNEVIVIARRVSKETGLSVGQVYDQWDGKRNRHNVKANIWNSYQVYHREHLAQERARLSQDVLERTPEAEIASLCYKKFKKKYGKKSDEILDSYRQVRELAGAANTTVARRKQEWNSWCSDMKQKANVGHLVHGFSSQILAVGNVINSDSSLAMIHASKDAEDFFPTRFRVDNDTAIGHMKALVYNNVSLAVVEMSQNDEDDATAGQLGAHAAGPSKSLAAASAITAEGPVGPKLVNVAQAAFREVLQDIKFPDSRGRAPFVVSAMRGLLRLLGPEGAAVANISNFQWKKFGMMLAAQNITMVNYPEEPVPMPRAGTDDDDTSAPPARSKGLSGLGARPLKFFMDTIMKPHRTHPLGFVLSNGLRADLLNSTVPVITGVPPRPSSDFTRGRRYFVNGVTDRAGLKRRLPSADDSDDEAPAYNKKLVASDSGDATDSDSDSDEEEVEPRVKAVDMHAVSPRQTRSKANLPQPDQNKTVDKATFADIAKAAGITLHTVAVEIPDSPITRKHAVDAITVSSGTGSRYSPSCSPTPGPSKSHGAKKRKADDLRCASEVSESLSDILAAAKKIDKGKQRAQDLDIPDDEHEYNDGNVHGMYDNAMSDSPPTKKSRGLDDRTSQDHGVRPSGTVLDVGQRVQPAHHQQVGTHVGPYVAPVEGLSVRHNLGQHVRNDLGQHVRNDLGQHVRTDLGQHVRTDLGQQVRTDLGQQVRTDLGQQVRTDLGQHVRNDLGQHVRTDFGPYVGPNVAPHAQPAGDPNRRTDAERQVQPTLGGNPIALPPFPPNLVRTDAAPHGRSDVMQHFLPRGNMYIGTHGGPHVQPAGDPNIHTYAGQHVQPVLGVNANALPPFPPDLHPPPMAHVGTHINQQGRGNVFGDIRNPDAAQVQHGARTYAPGRSELQPPGYPQLRSHDHPNNADGRVHALNGHPYNNRGAGSYQGASHGAHSQAPYEPYGSYPPHGYPEPRYMNAPAHQSGSNGGGFYPDIRAGLSYPQQYLHAPPTAAPMGSGTSTSPPPTYQTAQSAGTAYPQSGSHYAQQYHDGRGAPPVSSGPAQPMAHGNAPRTG